MAFQDRGISDTFAALICHGVLERFPALRLASIENGGDVVPDLLRNLAAARGRMPFAFGEDPVEQFRRQVWVAPFYEDDMAMLRDALGADRLLFGSDFPHTEGLPEPMMFVKDIPGFTLRRPQDHAGQRPRPARGQRTKLTPAPPALSVTGAPTHSVASMAASSPVLDPGVGPDPVGHVRDDQAQAGAPSRPWATV